MSPKDFAEAPCPSADRVRGIREVFYANKPFADNANPTTAEVDEWHRIAINHVRALVGYTSPDRQVEKDHYMFARALWGTNESLPLSGIACTSVPPARPLELARALPTRTAAPLFFRPRRIKIHISPRAIPSAQPTRVRKACSPDLSPTYPGPSSDFAASAIRSCPRATGADTLAPGSTGKNLISASGKATPRTTTPTTQCARSGPGTRCPIYTTPDQSRGHSARPHSGDVPFCGANNGAVRRT